MNRQNVLNHVHQLINADLRRKQESLGDVDDFQIRTDFEKYKELAKEVQMYLRENLK